MYRFFVDSSSIGQENISITGSDVNHIKNVLRMGIGEVILVSDGKDNEYTCSIVSLSDDEVIARIDDFASGTRELPISVTLFQALPKSDKMESIIQKNIELGINKIVPVKTKRCIVKLDEKKAASKTKRWNLIAEAAAKQSKRGVIPEVCAPVTFKEALNMAKEYDHVLIPYELSDDMDRTRDIISKIKDKESVAVLIGPEGGFAPEEVEAAMEMGASDITLGHRILRTETAGMMLMSVLMYLHD